MKKIHSFLLGADPECFIINTATNEIVSAIGLIPGKKGDPYTNNLPKGFGLEIDGILGEFNIPPCADKTEWIQSIKFMKEWLRDFLKNINLNLDIKCISSHIVPPEALQNPLAHQIGCMPDFNAYTERKNRTPEGYPNNMRVSGVHIHVGYEGRNPDTSCLLTKYMDLCLGVPSILYDTDQYRRTLYGMAGSFRMPKWGTEYRVLGGTMLNDDYLGFLWDHTEAAINIYNEGLPLPDNDLIQRCINTSNTVLAKHLINLYEICVD